MRDNRITVSCWKQSFGECFIAVGTMDIVQRFIVIIAVIIAMIIADVPIFGITVGQSDVLSTGSAASCLVEPEEKFRLASNRNNHRKF